MGEGHHIQDEKLIHKFNQVRSRMARNRLILVSVLNAITFLSFVFAMSFYQWVWIQLDFTVNRIHTQKYYYWVNLLYLKQDVPGSRYQNFGTAQMEICSTDIYCKAVFYGLSFVGYLCFGIFVVAGCLQVFDLSRIFYWVYKSGQMVEKKDNFRHIITIFTYIVGLSLSAFSILITDVVYHFGISFWLCVGTLVMFVAVIVYEQISIRKMIKQSLIQELLDKQIKTRNQKIRLATIQMQTHHQRQQGLTI